MSVISDRGMLSVESPSVSTMMELELLPMIFPSSCLPLVREMVAVVEHPQSMMSIVAMSFFGMCVPPPAVSTSSWASRSPRKRGAGEAGSHSGNLQGEALSGTDRQSHGHVASCTFAASAHAQRPGSYMARTPWRTYLSWIATGGDHGFGAHTRRDLRRRRLPGRTGEGVSALVTAGL